MRKGRTISTYTGAVVVEQIDRVAKLENRSRSYITGAAIKLMAGLPPLVWSALLQLQGQGNDENLGILHQDIARAFLHYQYRLGQRALETTVDPDFLNALTTEDEIIHAAIALTQNV